MVLRCLAAHQHERRLLVLDREGDARTAIQPLMSRDRRMEGRVRAMGRGGDAVVETSAGVVLLPGALPDERVELERIQGQRGVSRGRLLRILEENPARREPPCADTDRCGGCPLMMATPELQRQIKEGFLRDACDGLPGAFDAEIEWVASPAQLSYRRRARLAWHGEQLGYRQRRSKRVADIAQCLVLTKPLQQAWKDVRANLEGRLRGDGEVSLTLSGTDTVLVDLRTRDAQDPALFRGCEALSQEPIIAGVALRTEDSVHPALWGETQVAVRAADGGMLRGPLGAFSQANEQMNAELVKAVVALAEPSQKRVLELHAGIGNFTVSLAQSARSLVAVEQNPGAVAACRKNLKDRGLDARIVEGDANKPPKGRYDVVVLDPPRQGAKALFEDWALLPGPERVVYVSCDTATLARDLRRAADRGYRLDRIMAFDMFPQTAHLESLVRLVPQ